MGMHFHTDRVQYTTPYESALPCMELLLVYKYGGVCEFYSPFDVKFGKMYIAEHSNERVQVIPVVTLYEELGKKAEEN